jgi:hypothetical protein
MLCQVVVIGNIIALDISLIRSPFREWIESHSGESNKNGSALSADVWQPVMIARPGEDRARYARYCQQGVSGLSTLRTAAARLSYPDSGCGSKRSGRQVIVPVLPLSR